MTQAWEKGKIWPPELGARPATATSTDPHPVHKLGSLSTEPEDFCPLSSSLLKGNWLITLKMAAIPPQLYLQATWWFFLASVPKTPLSLRLPGTQPWPQRPLDIHSCTIQVRFLPYLFEHFL